MGEAVTASRCIERQRRQQLPFFMSDGVTLYYANDGDESIGGYDIFISRKGEDGFLQPQNIGMPYNSPYDDYMLAIDEVTVLAGGPPTAIASAT